MASGLDPKIYDRSPPLKMTYKVYHVPNVQRRRSKRKTASLSATQRHRKYQATHARRLVPPSSTGRTVWAQHRRRLPPP